MWYEAMQRSRVSRRWRHFLGTLHSLAGRHGFRPAFSYVNDLLEQGELKELAGLLYFTDGKGRYPAKRPDYRTAFLFLEDYDEAAVPPWAMRLLLEKEEFLN